MRQNRSPRSRILAIAVACTFAYCLSGGPAGASQTAVAGTRTAADTSATVDMRAAADTLAASDSSASADSSAAAQVAKAIASVIDDVIRETIESMMYVGPPSGVVFLEPGAQMGTPLGRSVAGDIGFSTEGGFRESWLLGKWGGGAITIHGEYGRGGWKAAVGYGLAAYGGGYTGRIATLRTSGNPSNANPGEWYVGPEIVIRVGFLQGCVGGLYRVGGEDRSGRLILSADAGLSWAWKL